VYEGVVQDLIDELGRLPGIGPKSAQRIAFHLLRADPEEVARLTTVLTEVKATIRFCARCGNVAQAELCRICSDPRRDQSKICVVEAPKDERKIPQIAIHGARARHAAAPDRSQTAMLEQPPFEHLG